MYATFAIQHAAMRPNKGWLEQIKLKFSFYYNYNQHFALLLQIFKIPKMAISDKYLRNYKKWTKVLFHQLKYSVYQKKIKSKINTAKIDCYFLLHFSAKFDSYVTKCSRYCCKWNSGNGIPLYVLLSGSNGIFQSVSKRVE